jgi:hypothetical protein
MIVLIDGQPVRLHPVVETMIALLVDGQAQIWQRGQGVAHLYYEPGSVRLKVYNAPAVNVQRKTADRAHRPSAPD